MPATHQRLYINIDHVATLRQARRGSSPDPVEAALTCERAGSDGITAHLREDRRHIQDDDVRRLAQVLSTSFNLEMALTTEMLGIAESLRPYQVTLVPERREEITTEGGLDIRPHLHRIGDDLERMKRLGIRTSLFIAPDVEQVQLARDVGADAIELHTGSYSHAPGDPRETHALQESATFAASLGLAVHAGHGLTVDNVRAVAAIAEVEELNIGHAIVGRAVFVGLDRAVREMRAAMVASR